MSTKFSRQRQAIWINLKDRRDHPTAEEIYNSVRQQYPNISLGTVYRNLMHFREEGLIRTVEVGDGVIHFDPDTSEHDHFICTSCGRVTDIRGIDSEKIRAAASRNFSGEIRGYSTYFYGLCEDCANSRKNIQNAGDQDNPETSKNSI